VSRGAFLADKTIQARSGAVSIKHWLQKWEPICGQVAATAGASSTGPPPPAARAPCRRRVPALGNFLCL